MKITLISAATYPSDQGIRTISSVLKKAGHNVNMVFMTLSEDYSKFYTNYELNVWNYIIPAIIEGIIWDVVQIRNETNLNQYLNTSSSSQSYSKKNENKWIILNLDLDFFRPELDYINYELKKKVILDIADKASIITVATSPFFVTQNHVLKVFKDIFW